MVSLQAIVHLAGFPFIRNASEKEELTATIRRDFWGFLKWGWFLTLYCAYAAGKFIAPAAWPALLNILVFSLCLLLDIRNKTFLVKLEAIGSFKKDEGAEGEAQAGESEGSAGSKAQAE